MLTSKQRAYLRGIANTYETVLIVGKGGITENLIKQADETLEARELIKGRVLETSDSSAMETADTIAEKTKSDVVQVIGSKFILFRQKKKESQFVLPKSKKKS